MVWDAQLLLDVASITGFCMIASLIDSKYTFLPVFCVIALSAYGYDALTVGFVSMACVVLMGAVFSMIRKMR